MVGLTRALDWPPVWTAGAVALAWLGGLVLPWGVLGAAGPVLAAALLLAGLGLMAAAVVQMLRARTTVIPRQAPRALVTRGVFGISRNPIYLGDLLVVAAALLWFQVPWALPLLAGFARVLTTRFIAAEEARLIEAFGAEYGLWAGRVNRWLGWR